LAYPGVNIQKDVENPMGVPKKMYKLAYNPIEVEFIAIAMPKKVENQFLKKKLANICPIFFGANYSINMHKP